MPAFKALLDDDPLLMTSPLIRGVLKTAEYIEDNAGKSPVSRTRPLFVAVLLASAFICLTHYIGMKNRPVAG